MGRLLGAHASDELDRPDLNKCPDCGCFFPQDNCPICGKECPEEFRAGNRKAVKPKKHKNSSGRVQFIEWYHSWWFILIMMFVMPVVGIILLLTSPHNKVVKTVVITIIAIVVVGGFLAGYGVIQMIDNILNEPVDRKMSFEDYVAECEELSPEDFYRSAGSYDGKLVTMTLTVEEGILDAVGYYAKEEYTTYYICTDGEGNEFKILIRDCETEPENYIKGDVISVYGVGAGMLTIDDIDYVAHSAPCIYAAYIVD
ncbi:MAG: hypothetical protein IKU19_00305 [Clostridia bacterium]|nr:hypothetical protein [Clostridia bacterium]